MPRPSAAMLATARGELVRKLPDTGTSKWIAEHGEGLFHICLEVDDIDAAMDELRGKGMTFQQDEPMIGHGNCRIVFLDPASTGNLVIELAEMPKDHAAHAAE